MPSLVNLMFRRLGKFDGPIFGGAYTRGGEVYIRFVNWVTYLGVWGRIFVEGGCLYMGGVLTGLYGIFTGLTLINLAEINCVPIKTFLCISRINGSFCHLISANFSECFFFCFFLLRLNLQDAP